MMQILFIGVTLTGLAYFLLKKRRFDFFPVAFFSGCAYFMPGLFGHVLYPTVFVSSEALGEHVEIVPGAYLIMTLVLAGILLSAIFFDSLADKSLLRLRFRGDTRTLGVYLIFTVISLVLVVFTSGSSLLNSDKNTMMESLNRWFILFEISCSLLFVTAVSLKSRSMIIIGLCFLFFDMYLGFRGISAIGVLAAFLLFFHAAGRKSLLAQNIKYFLIGLIGALTLFVYKGVFIAIKLGQWNRVVDNLSNLDFYLFWISNSEPFVTQAILNKVVDLDFHTGYDHIVAAFNQLILFGPELGAEDISFNTYFQNALFPSTKGWGMANNIWAQMYSAGGWTGVLIFIFIYCLVLGLLSRALLVLEGAGAAIVATMGCYWAFFIHRNDLTFQLLLEKRVLILGLVVLILADLMTCPPAKSPAAT